MSAFVWGEDFPSGAASSTIQDPLTGNAIRTLSYAGIEVSSRIGFENTGADEVGTFLNYTTTIANSTDSTLSVRYGGISVDGHVASPLWVVPPGQKLSKRERKSKPDLVELGKIHCFTSGFLSRDKFFSANASSQLLIVAPRTALTVSSVVRDPRSYSPLDAPLRVVILPERCATISNQRQRLRLCLAWSICGLLRHVRECR